jgi:hypothetical protein
METSVFDVFQSVKTLLYLGNYNSTCEEAENTDINEEDLSQIVKRYFYIFLSYVEDQKTDELNTFMGSLKGVNNQTIKIYYNLFLFYYLHETQFNEKKFYNLYNDLKEVKRFDPILFPAVYIISLMLLERKEYQNFLTLIEKFEQDIEILSLKFYFFFQLNKVTEMEKVINTMIIKDSDSIITQICGVIFNLYKTNDHESINVLQMISKNHKMTPKMFNLIGVALMSKGLFEEAHRVLNFGKDICEKSGIASTEYSSLLVNLICCYRNLPREEELKNAEEILRKNDPNNQYFLRLANFEEEFAQLTK